MRGELIGAAIVLGLAGVVARADWGTPARQVQIQVAIKQGDPLGSRAEGTVKVLAEPNLITVEGRPARLMWGGSGPVGVSDESAAADAAKEDRVATGCQVKVLPRVQADGRIRLRLAVQYFTILERARDHTLSQTNRASYVRSLDPGETMKVRLQPDQAGKVLWAEVKAQVIVPPFRSPSPPAAAPEPAGAANQDCNARGDRQKMAGVPVLVGQIILVGNDKTSQDVILRQVPLYPGQPLHYPYLRLAERNLERLHLFVNDPKKGIRPTVTVIDPDVESPVKDILIRVQEK